MQLMAKPVLADKFWIVERDGQKVGTIRTNEKGVTLTVGKQNHAFSKLEDLEKKMSVTFTDRQITTTETTEHEIYNFPCKTKPFNAIFDLKRKLPLYTKTENSQSFFCAGYYVIHWEDGNHSPAYNPKLLTLSRYTYEGPFKTKLEMTETLRKTT